MDWANTERWMSHGLCAQTDPELFFPEKGGGYSHRAAQRICLTPCPVLTDCGDWALGQDQRDLHGVWAGMTRVDRARELKRRALEA
jgi:WhiB family redox-sensing transcriptional regulator